MAATTPTPLAPGTVAVSPEQTAPIPLPPAAVRHVLELAYAEDAPSGDLTSLLLIPAQARATAELRAREAGIFSGGPVIEAGFRLHDPEAAVELVAAEGEAFDAGAVLARVTGRARAILTAERVVLNLVQRLSAIAAVTARYVALTAGTRARIVDTRKTTPGLRELERYAVRCGGGRNHRFSLSDAVMAKDNHLAVLTGGDASRLTGVLSAARERLGHTTHFEVEVDRIEQIEPVLAAGVDTIMLDNFTPEQLREGVAMIAGRAIVEASGGVNLGTVAEIAATGVDVISVGALTHSVVNLDLGLDVVVDVTVGTPGGEPVTS
ncbi:carboxylating nicotinate-nucleotide diphosphorylase [Sinomonas notoginsengisoli]|uniref:carboxylating nicotinate-nucleotide diphosphorylase n=1 Tax=Sinomonas notoginsengisoli TaxID=1457311 RepID=UPI001F46148F|nr:carboxylating nicotinate-nucleotide diphosphorylase [Sinomonas notoginsengisoli]